MLWVGLAAAMLGLVATGVFLAGLWRVPSPRLWWPSLLAAFGAWLLALAAFPRTASSWLWPHWQSEGVWQLNPFNWPLVVTAATLPLVALLLDASRPRRSAQEGRGWAAVLWLAGGGVLAVLAFSPAAFAASWAFLDVAIAAADLARFQRSKHNSAVIWVAFVRAGSWVLAMTAAAAAAHPGAWLNPETLMAAAVALRLAVAVAQPAVAASDLPPWRLTWAAENALATLAAAVWLAQREVTLPTAAAFWGVALLSLWAVNRWARAQARLRRVWAAAAALGGLALLAALRGSPEGALAWGLLAVYPAVGMALAPHRGVVFWPFFVLLALPLTLWPVSPAAAAVALWQPPYAWWMVFPGLTVVIAWVAVARSGIDLPPPERPVGREARSFSLVGLLLWVLVFWGWRLWPPLAAPAVSPLLAWGGGVLTLAVAAPWFRAVRRGYLQAAQAEALLAAWRTRWVSAAFWWTYRALRRGLAFFSLLLEGEGGVMWALVLLVMLAVLLHR